MVDPVGAATALLDLATRVYNAYASVGDQIDTWGGSQASLIALRQLVAALPKVADGPDLKKETDDLIQKLQKALDSVSQLLKERQKSVLTQVGKWHGTKKAVKEASQELTDVQNAAEIYTKLLTLRLDAAQLSELVKVSNQHREAKRDAAVEEVNKIMAGQFAPDGFMRFLDLQAKKPGYPLDAFVNKEPAATRKKMLTGMTALWPAWKKLGKCIKDGTLDVDYFKDNLSLLHQGRTYRTLVEPLEICNWYWGRKHVTGSHYVDGIGLEPLEECTQDNNKRPGRYMYLQDMEMKVLGKAESSLGIARRLQQDAELAAKVAAVAAWDDEQQTG